MLMSQTWSYM
ncbi:hypothetical protein F383_07516 [Gossypium arboreum]|uniref:Uncharacterized protein n=1 Tax=Gossypium arboreum TaxID=29729 RepID=A0A0B0PR45_GOSAR|nr:hypothetical protein F383_07516 [Gossypium arboreum]